MDELRRNVEVEQTLDGLRSNGPGTTSPPTTSSPLYLTDFLEYRFKRREIGMNVVDGCDAHVGIPLIAVTQIEVI